MEIQAYNFFFHPLHEDHHDAVKALSVITNIALSVLSAGIYVAIFALAHIAERFHMWDNKGYVGNEALKQKQKIHLAKLQALASNGEWQHLQQHTSHPDSGFDWWMFPTDRKSRGQGARYQVDFVNRTALRRDPEFMKSYRDGVILVAKSWGFDLENLQDVTTNSQKWVGYSIRLCKMLHSLHLFNQKDLFDNLVYFIDKYDIRSEIEKKEPWIKKYIG